QQARAEGRPYHAVHFDGHGTYRNLRSAAGRKGKQGVIAFERSGSKNNQELVDGQQLGALLAEMEVPVLVLNACRSAHAEPSVQPQEIREADPDAQVQAFGSFAQEVMDAGVGGVVAMRYNVYVVTAAQMMAELYASLARGRSLGEAITVARKNLADQ